MAITPKKKLPTAGKMPGGSSGGKASTGKVSTVKAKPVVKVPTQSALKKSGLAKLAKINKPADTAHIDYAVRHGKITPQEAAAIDPKNFDYLLDKSSKTIGTIDLNKLKGKK